LRFKKTTLLTMFAGLIGSLSLVPFIGMEFIPGADQGQMQISVEAPNGTKLEEMLPIVEKVGSLLKPYEEIIETSYYTVGSGGGFGGGSSNTASFTVVLVGATQRDIATTDVVQAVASEAANIAGAEITVSELETGLSSGSPI